MLLYYDSMISEKDNTYIMCENIILVKKKEMTHDLLIRGFDDEIHS